MTNEAREAGIAQAAAAALAAASAYYFQALSNCEVWEVSADEVTIRAWLSDDESVLWSAYLPWA